MVLSFVFVLQFDNDMDPKLSNQLFMNRDDKGDLSIQRVRDWVDRYEEAVTNHYSQELRARLSAVQVNGVHSDLKFTASLRHVEKCRTSLLSTGGKVCCSLLCLRGGFYTKHEQHNSVAEISWSFIRMQHGGH